MGGQYTFQKKYLPKLSMQGQHVCEGEYHVVIILPCTEHAAQGRRPKAVQKTEFMEAREGEVMYL